MQWYRNPPVCRTHVLHMVYGWVVWWVMSGQIDCNNYYKVILCYVYIVYMFMIRNYDDINNIIICIS